VAQVWRHPCCTAVVGCGKGTPALQGAINHQAPSNNQPAPIPPTHPPASAPEARSSAKTCVRSSSLARSASLSARSAPSPLPSSPAARIRLPQPAGGEGRRAGRGNVREIVMRGTAKSNHTHRRLSCYRLPFSPRACCQAPSSSTHRRGLSS
jgi:hypothetical protein